MMKKNIHGFSMVELLVTLVISIILMMIVGVISTIANVSYEKERRKADIYNNIYYAFNLMKYNARRSFNNQISVNNTIKTLTFTRTVDPPTANPSDPKTFTLVFYTRFCTPAVDGCPVTQKKFAYNENITYNDDSNNNIDHVVIGGLEPSLVFDFQCSKDSNGNWISTPVCENNDTLFHIILSGEKKLGIGKPQGQGTQGSVKFNVSTDVMRRN